MTRWGISLFGGVRVEIDPDGEPRQVSLEPRPLALLAYLAADVVGRLRPRDATLTLLWPERSEPRARSALRQALHHLQRRLGPGLLVRQGRLSVGVDPQRISCDVHRFERALLEGRPRDALREYRGDFLEGFVLSSQPEPFEEWLQATRLRLRDNAVAAAVTLLEPDPGGSAAGLQPALGWVHRALALSPYSEDLLARAVDLRLDKGDRGGAVEEVRGFSKRLLEDVGVGPSERVRRLGERAVADVPLRDSAPKAVIQLPADGLKSELESVLSGRAIRVESRVEIAAAGGRRRPGRVVIEGRGEEGGCVSATVRIESLADSRASQDRILRSERVVRKETASEQDEESEVPSP